MLDDVVLIRAASLHGAKYDALLEHFRGFDRTRPIRIVYLSPAPIAGLPLSDVFFNVTFAGLAQLDVERHAEAWMLFRKLVLPALIPDGPPPASRG